VIALQPFANAPALQLMTHANVWLDPFQGLVAAAMSAFFVKAAHANPGESAARHGAATQ
jgi:hypothetical protein